MPVIGNLQKEKGSNLEIEDLEKEMCKLYRICNINEDINKERDRKDEVKETPLEAPGKG